jgi:hypothetical protein
MVQVHYVLIVAVFWFSLILFLVTVYTLSVILIYCDPVGTFSNDCYHR